MKRGQILIEIHTIDLNIAFVCLKFYIWFVQTILIGLQT